MKKQVQRVSEKKHTHDDPSIDCPACVEWIKRPIKNTNPTTSQPVEDELCGHGREKWACLLPHETVIKNNMNNLSQIKKEILKEFDKKCIVNKDGHCKYFNPEAFGYDKDDNEAPVYKFFPEKIKEMFSKALDQVAHAVIEYCDKEVIEPDELVVGEYNEVRNDFRKSQREVLSLLEQQLK